ncbi:MAG: hypothetical protein PHE67_00305 [Campylobacterales bacterium]|nr:hypothetical protein [Campylobacterales bacterium]
MRVKITPFANETDSTTIGQNEGLTVENRIDRVSIYGSVDITRDKQGLSDALQLKQLVDAVVEKLSNEPLLDKIETIKPDEVENPLA